MLTRKSLIALLVALLSIAVIGRAQSADDRYPFVRDGKVGFIDSQGNEVIPPKFGTTSDHALFKNGLAPVFEANRGFGYIDTSGIFVIGPTFEWGWGRPFYEGIAAVMLIGKNGAQNEPAWIDQTGKVVLAQTGTEGTYFSDGLMRMPRDGKWGFVNKKFEFVIPPQFDFAYEFSEGRAEVTINDKSGFIDTSGNIVIPVKYDMVWGFQDGLARVRYDIPDGKWQTIEGDQTRYKYKYGFVDHAGVEVIPLQFQEATYFSEGYALVVPPNSDRYAIIDKAGNFITKPRFDEVEEFHEGLAKACVKRKCGFVDTTGAWVIRPAFQYAAPFWHGLARVAWKDADYGYVNKSGRIVWRITRSDPRTPTK